MTSTEEIVVIGEDFIERRIVVGIHKNFSASLASSTLVGFAVRVVVPTGNSVLIEPVEFERRQL